MSSKPLKKEPKQERSKQIVSSILDAATRILSALPLGETTTKKIAEVAGVGIGSLYDYFPDKKSIVVGLIDRRIESSLQEFGDLLKDPKHQSPQEKINAVMTYLFTEFIDKRPFLREIFFLAPESGRVFAIFESRIILTRHVDEYLKIYKPEFSEKDRMERAFLCIASVMGIVESYVVTDPVITSREGIESAIRKIIIETLDLR